MQRCRISAGREGSFGSGVPCLSAQGHSGHPARRLCGAGASSPSDVTLPASLIERDANPAPKPGGGLGCDGERSRFERRTTKAVACAGRGRAWRRRPRTPAERRLKPVFGDRTSNSCTSSAHLLGHLRGRDPPEWSLLPGSQAPSPRAWRRGSAAGAAPPSLPPTRHLKEQPGTEKPSASAPLTGKSANGGKNPANRPPQQLNARRL